MVTVKLKLILSKLYILATLFNLKPTFIGINYTDRTYKKFSSQKNEIFHKNLKIKNFL